MAARSTPLILVARAHRNDDYLASLTKVGARPLLVGSVQDFSAGGWGDVAGVLLTGGPDVDPRLYGETPDPSCDLASPERDGFEIELVARAIERDLPVLAICRGAQVLNVACGGSLVQDIPTAIPRPLDHQVKPVTALAHPVFVAPESQLARALEFTDARTQPSIGVNSRHHQAVKRAAPGLVVSATAGDGVIEAIERPASRFCVGVQWHPENFWRTGEFDALFRSFVRACGG